MKSAKERLHDEYFDGIPAPQPGQDVPDYSHGLKALAEAIDDVRRGLEDQITALVEEMKKTPVISEVNEELAGLEKRINEVQNLADQFDGESRVAERLDEVEKRLAGLEDGDVGPVGAELGRLSEAQGGLTSLVQELESRLEDVEEGMDVQDEGQADMIGMIKRLERRVADLEEAQSEAGHGEAQSEDADREQDQNGRARAGEESASEPCWHDRPPESGVYIRAYERGKPEVARIVAPAALDIPESETFYGPIPEKEGTGLETYV